MGKVFGVASDGGHTRMAILRPRSRTAVLVCVGQQAYATAITPLPINSRESACACPPWYARLSGVVEVKYGLLMGRLHALLAFIRP